MTKSTGTKVPEAINDSWDDRQSLREALDRPELDFFDDLNRPPGEPPETAGRAAYDLALALGRCRLHGVELGEDDGVLPLEIAQSAMTRLIAGLDNVVEITGELGERSVEAADPIEIETLCLNLLRRRLDAWAAFLAIDEAYAAALEESETGSSSHGADGGLLVAGSPTHSQAPIEGIPAPATALSITDMSQRARNAGMPSQLMPLIDAIDRYDDALLDQLDVLSIVADVPMIKTWKARLAPQFKIFLPWFLDGTLEREAESLKQVVLRLAPAETHLKFPIRKVPPPLGSLIKRCELAAAAATPGKVPERPITVSWSSPGGKMMARSDIPRGPYYEEDQVVDVVMLETNGGGPADVEGLLRDGARAILAGVERPILEEGFAILARFRLADLPSDQELVLTVGDDVWDFAGIEGL